MTYNSNDIDETEEEIIDHLSDAQKERIEKRKLIQFAGRLLITVFVISMFVMLLLLLFYVKDSDEQYRDIINVTVGGFLASFGKIIDWWFKSEDIKER
tara:strand:+ start:117 stop:410 length:294 start_codon:yes stop_codon:yes gene_type:complete